MKRVCAGALLLAAAGCGRAAAPVPSWDDAGAPVASASASASAAPAASAPAGACSYDPKDLPEPVAPAAECSFRREVKCVPPSPVRSAWQKWFPACPTEHEAWARSSSFPGKVRFSAKETCKSPESCCYVQFVAVDCD